MQQSTGTMGHRKHRQAFGDKRKQKSPRFRLWAKLEAERAGDRRARRGSMFATIAELFGRTPR